MSVLKIAVVGAPGTGKAKLAEALDCSMKAAGLHVIFTTYFHPERDTSDLVFLMGLKSGCPASTDADQSIRTLLTNAGVRYQVLYGSPDERVAQALRLIEKTLAVNGFSAPLAEKTSRSHKPWTWACDKCSDPQCEYTLFSDLLAERASSKSTEPPMAVVAGGPGA